LIAVGDHGRIPIVKIADRYLSQHHLALPLDDISTDTGYGKGMASAELTIPPKGLAAPFPGR
jgi:hypothetical protein